MNDGSPDDSLKVILALQQKDKNIKIIDLSRNFGHHKAIMTGLAFAKGDYIFFVDSDLEEPPELLIDCWNEINKKENIDLVYGVQNTRKGAFVEKYIAGFYYKIFNFLSDYKLTENILNVRLMSKRYLKQLLQHKEYDLMFSGLCVITGFNHSYVMVNKGDKKSSSYSLAIKLNVLIDSITSFSQKPLIMIFNLGMVLLLLTTLAILYLIFSKLFLHINIAGWTSLIVSIWFFGGLIISCLGIIGIYISKIYIQTKNRPYTIVKTIYEENEDDL